MIIYKCLSCSNVSDENLLINCPINGIMCPICGSDELESLDYMYELTSNFPTDAVS